MVKYVMNFFQKLCNNNAPTAMVETQKLSLDSLKTLSGLTSPDNEETISEFLENFDERKWRLSFLTDQFELLQLHWLYKLYTDKINYGYLSLYLILAFLITFGHFFVVLFSNFKGHLATVIPDLIFYLLYPICCLFALYYIDRISKSKWKLLPIFFASFLTFINFFVPLYHSLMDNDSRYRPIYTVVLILGCYIFFCIHKLWKAITFGIIISFLHVFLLIFVTYWGDKILWKKAVSDVIFLICVNSVGIYFRYINEIVKRRSFLDTRDYILSMLQLQHEKDQEEDLMASIIPKNLVNKVKQQYLEKLHYHIQQRHVKKYSFAEKGHIIKPSEDPNELLSEHDNVSILFSDIVNYTNMTTKLNITELLETLNELFGRFDDASEKLGVVRIKFLGDCYYCVSGLPPNLPKNHAEACVDLGLEMINIIQRVRSERNLDINMRIGIHTGKIISGIIGAIKYQYDIWSKDVDLSNKMESEGQAGFVHITEETRRCLTKKYEIKLHESGKFMKEYNVKTYLVSGKISPKVQIDSNENKIYSIIEQNVHQNMPRLSIFKKNGNSQLATLPSLIEDQNTDTTSRISTVSFSEPHEKNDNTRNSVLSNSRGSLYRRRASSSYLTKNRMSEERRITTDIKRRTAFMNHNIKRHVERYAAVNDEMENTIQNMSFSKRDQYTKVSQISSLLFFKNITNELEYVKASDPLFKHYILGNILILFCIYAIQNLTLSRWDAQIWPFISTELFLIFVMLPLTWTNFIWTKYYKDYTESGEPNNFIIKFLYKCSKCITTSSIARHVIYFFIFILFGFYVLKEMIECENILNKDKRYPNILIEYTVSFFKNIILKEKTVENQCVLPWQITETCALAILLTFVYLKMIIYVKLLFAVTITTVYSVLLINYIQNYYKDTESINYGIDAPIAHILYIVFLTITLHLIDRQTDYMNRQDYISTLNLLRDKRKAAEQQLVNKNLLLNILPKHVAENYLDVNREFKNELYHEDHSNVAVMFASIIIDEDIQNSLNGRDFLKLMNEYITAYDKLINRPEYSSVEKIKIAKWTYMAACGLVPGGKFPSIEKHATSSVLNILINFAADMFKKTSQVNGCLYNCTLRIGISHGPIVAGVVGSRKPLYDIWGNAVNMASRMDTTGVVGKIQVLEDTAAILKDSLGYVCELRGKTKVKGLDDEVNTYFVKLDDNFNLVKGARESIERDSFLNESYS